MKFIVVSPEKKVLETDCISATLPTSEGQITILPGHMPLFALLSPGEVVIRSASRQEQSLAVGSGFLNFYEDNVILLTDFGVNSDEIDEEEIKKARARAEEILTGKADQTAMAQAQANLARSILQLKISTHRKNLHL